MAFEIFSLVGKISLKGIENANKGITKYDKQIKDVGRSFKKAGLLMSGFGVLAVASATKFEKQMAMVNTQLDETTAHLLPKFRDGIQGLSTEFGESTESLSKGLYDILSAGIAAEDGMDVLRESAVAAKAGLTTTAVAADALTTVLNAYGLEARQAGEVSDWMFSVVRRGKTTFAELAPVLGRVASLAATAGLDLDELGAALSTMTKAGIKTEEAVTSLRGVMNTFLKPTTEAKKVAKELGVELNTNTLRTEGLVPTLEKLNNATDEQVAAIFGNVRALSGLSTILKDTSVFYGDLEFIQDKSGKTQEAFNKIAETTSFRLGQMRQMFNKLLVTVGDKLLPDVLELTAKIIKLTEGIIELNPAILKWAILLGSALLPIGILLVSLPKIVVGIKLVTGAINPATLAILLAVVAISKLVSILSELSSELDGADKAIKNAAGEQKKLQNIMKSGVSLWKEYGEESVNAIIEQGITMEEAKLAMEGMFSLSSRLQGEDRQKWVERAEKYKQVYNELEAKHTNTENKKLQTTQTTLQSEAAALMAKFQTEKTLNAISLADFIKKYNIQDKILIAALNKQIKDIDKSAKTQEEIEKDKFEKFERFAEKWGASYDENIKDMLKGTDNFAEGLENIWESLIDAMISEIARLIAKWTAFLALKGIASLLGLGSLATAAGKVLGFKEGGDFTVPPGFDNDTFPMAVSSGERVQVTPANEARRGQSTGGGISAGDTILQLNMPIENIELSPENVEETARRFTDQLRAGATELLDMAKEISLQNTFTEGEA